jgi:formylglycine-generating enzyme required for sulfatase activity
VLGLSSDDKKAVQTALRALGFNTGLIDGDLGPNSREAIKDWQKKSGEQQTGYLTPSQYDRLLAEAGPKLAALESARKAEQPSGVQPSGRYQPGDEFRDCPECPEMVVVPAGRFMMGSPPDEPDRYDNEGPQHWVKIPRPFAVGKYEITFAEWDGCVADGGCDHKPDDQGWGRGDRPVINVSWNEAQEYVAWLSRKGQKSYRLLTEAEWEYVARAGSATARWWGRDLGRNNANCDGCGSPWDGQQTAPVGSFDANAFGLHDMLGNVTEWVEDPLHLDRLRPQGYEGAPTDGSSWTTRGDYDFVALRDYGVLRGGSWADGQWTVRSAFREEGHNNHVYPRFGFRVARTVN